MENESRVRKTLLNARMNTICYIVGLFVSFFTRKIFISQLGTDFIGLTGAVGSLLGFLNIAELGIGTAIGVTLYKPIFDKNTEEICRIISLLGYMYKRIGQFILLAGFILSLFLPLIFPDTIIPMPIVYLCFYTYLCSSLLGYFVNYKANLLGADQKDYVVTGYYQVTSAICAILQMILALKVQSFALFLILNLFFAIINSIILNYKINKTYPWLNSEISKGALLIKEYPNVVKKVKQLFIHKVATFVQLQITPFLIYSYVSLPMVALYGNYTIVIDRLGSFIKGVTGSVGASIGNLIAEGDKNKIYDMYKQLFALQSLICGTLFCSVYYMIDGFIVLWLGDEYVLFGMVPMIAVLISFLMVFRSVTDHFLIGYGLFNDIWAPFVESILFVAVSMICGRIWGLVGVLMGSVVSLLVIVYMWKPYFLFTQGFKICVFKYINIFVSHISSIALSFFVSSTVMNWLSPHIAISNRWFSWIICGFMFFALQGITLLAVLLLCSAGMRMLIKRYIIKV